MKTLIAVLLLSLGCLAQTHTTVDVESNQTVTGQKTFQQSATFSGGLTATSVNQDIYTALQPGADFCARLTNAIAAAPSGGARIIGESGAQTCAATVVINKPVEIDLGAITLTGPASGDILNPTVGGYKIIGCGRSCTVLKPQTAANGHGIHGSSTGGTSFTIRDLQILDSTAALPNVSTRTAGAGIRIDHQAAGTSSWGQIENVDVFNMFNGYDFDNPITTNVTGGWLQNNVQDGVHDVGGTSTNYTATYANGNGRYNWLIQNKTYGSYNGTASDNAGNNGPAYTISSIASVSNTVTVTLASSSPVVAFQWVTIAGVTDTTFNGTFETLSSTGSSFTYSLTGGDRSSSGGTAKVTGAGYAIINSFALSFNGAGTESSSGFGVLVHRSNDVHFVGRVLNAVGQGILCEGCRDLTLTGHNTGNGSDGVSYGLSVLVSPGAFNGAASVLNPSSVVNLGMAFSDGGVSTSSVVRASNVVTVQTVSPHGLTNGNMVNIGSTTAASFQGWFKVQSVSDSTHFTYNESGPNDTASVQGQSLRNVNVTAAQQYVNLSSGSFNGLLNGGNQALTTDELIIPSQQQNTLKLGSRQSSAVDINMDVGTGAGGIRVGDGTGSGTPVATISSAGLGTFNGGLVPGSAGGADVGSASLPWANFWLGSAATNNAKITGTFAAARTLTVPDPGAAASFSYAQVEDCGATSGGTQACAKTVLAIPIIVKGDVQLNTATTQSITTLPFTNANYSCTGSDLTTTTGTVFFNTYANASVTIGENGGVNTDHLRYICVGN